MKLLKTELSGDATKASVDWGKRAVQAGLERILPYMKEFMGS